MPDNAKPMLLVLDGSILPGGASSNYRGVYRRPPFTDARIANTEAHNQFLEFCRHADGNGVLNDLQLARQIVAAYTQLSPPEVFDIVEVTPENGEALVAERLLGFDIALGGVGLSLLSWSLKFPAIDSTEKVFPRIGTLTKLLEEHFSSQLNESGLFDGPSSAAFLLECMVALQEARPGLWTSESMDRFQIVGVHLVSEQ